MISHLYGDIILLLPWLTLQIKTFVIVTYPARRARFIFLSEEKEGSPCLNCVQPLNSPKLNLLDWSILFSVDKLDFRERVFLY